MSFESLPTEIISHIIYSVTSHRDLLNLIGASPISLRIYAESREEISSAVRQNALHSIHPSVLRHAVAASRVTAIPASVYSEYEDTDDEFAHDEFLDEYFQTNNAFELPTDEEDILILSKIYSRTCHLIDGYCARAMRALGVEPGAQPPPLSRTESARLERAFFRYEIYSRLYHDSYIIEGPPTPSDERNDRFLDHVSPWEAEEMCCVHQYFTFIVSEFLHELEDEFLQAVLAIPGFDLPPSQVGYYPSFPALQRYRRNRAWYRDVLIDYNFSPFKRQWRSRLYNYSKGGRFVRPYVINYLVSFGSEFIYRLTLVDKNARRDLILNVLVDFVQPFFPTTLLDDASNNRPQTDIPIEIDYDDLSQPSLGWYLFGRSLDYTDNIMHCPLRERAFIFWDPGRIISFKHNLQRARSMKWDEVKSLFDVTSRKSVEERLGSGVRISRDQADMLGREFGPRADVWDP